MELINWIREQYVILIIIFLVFYIGFAFLAPILMHFNRELPAIILYKIYSNFCHQFAFRSFFLFGEQYFYPAHVSRTASEIKDYETVFNEKATDIQTARMIIGNEIVGYKVGFCQRDTAMYTSLLVIAILYKITNRKIKKISVWVWFILGLVPLGIDGVWQLFSNQVIFDVVIPQHESTVLLRTITGGLFGLSTGWYLLPVIEQSIKLKE